MKIGMLCPYFGKLPNYFQLTLESMKYNSDIDWFLITDNEIEYTLPPNVYSVILPLSDLVVRINKTFDFNINVVDFTPYKLCDFKPFYKMVFSDVLSSYDFWGHYDIDCIYGRISNFVTQEILNEYQKILFLGHFSLYKNDVQTNALIQDFSKKDIIRKCLCDLNNIYVLDEEIIIQYLYYKLSFFYSMNFFADIYPLKYQFNLVNVFIKEENRNINFINCLEKTNLVFEYWKGRLNGVSIEDDKIRKKEYMYVHLQKRKMFVSLGVKDSFLIVPNKFIPHKDVDLLFLRANEKKKLFYKPYFLYKLKSIKRRLTINRFDLNKINE